MAKKVTISGATDKPRPFKVRALQVGYYDHSRRRPGDVFVIADEQAFSARWMERVPEQTPERVTGPNAAIRQHHDDILSGGMARAAGSVLGDDTPDTDSNPLDA